MEEITGLSKSLDVLALDKGKKSKKRRSKLIRINFLTWNTNSKPPPPGLRELFVYTADIYAIGFQELGTGNWLSACDQVMEEENLVRIKSRKLQGMMIIVYVQRHLLESVTNIESEITRTGLGGVWGNKGGVTIRFTIYGVTVAIVNCHLAAHMENVAQRVQDVNDIIDNQKFRDETVNSLLDHDYVFWMGDTNFRIDDISYDDALEHIANRRLSFLLEKDQLGLVMRQGLIFRDFEEAPIQFLPTYKFDVGTDTYDTSAKKRVPAYCDRIIYFYHKVTYGKDDTLDVVTMDYRSHPFLTISDHKPVTATMDIHGLSKPPHSPITFDVNKMVHRKANMAVIANSRDMELTKWDWIGVFLADFVDITAFIAYSYVSLRSKRMAAVQFAPTTFTNIPNGTELVVCYFSKKASLCGISKTLKLKA